MAFSLISQGIEVLGYIWFEYLNGGDPRKISGDARSIFDIRYDKGLSLFPQNQGRKYTDKKIKSKLRNPLIHQLRPDQTLIISSSSESRKFHLKKDLDGNLIFSLDTFFKDFCKASDQLIKDLSSKFKNVENPYDFVNTSGVTIEGQSIAASGVSFPLRQVNPFAGENNSFESSRL